MMHVKRTAAALGIGFAALMAAPAMASTTTYNFDQWTTTTSLTGDNLYMVVSGDSSGTTFTFYNYSGTASSITDIYFSDSLLPKTTTAAISDSGDTVAFSKDATPPSFPNSQTTFTTGYSADSDEPIVANGVNAGTEYVSFYVSGLSVDAANACLENGTCDVGLHVQGIGTTSGSDWYLAGDAPIPPSEVPVPAAAWLFGSALLGFIGMANKRRV